MKSRRDIAIIYRSPTLRNEANKIAIFDIVGEQSVASVQCEVVVGSMLNEIRISAKKPQGGSLQLCQLRQIVDGRSRGAEIVLPERMGKEVLRQGLDEDLIVDPDEVEVRWLGDHNPSTTNELMCERRDMATVLCRNKPKMRSELVKPARTELPHKEGGKTRIVK